ncbi:MAG: DUF1016 N-terminal domain-containing protein [Sulfurimonas sp.]|jgi:hypothetical protein|uniref:DUF1016 N-terminal domain-containing protein n=1 Tax=Sulfurimonas sp. TaxID=2022749 RepID=UPI002625C432|nr:DUF1016 N-terminal domain-containing protein [Sulfurimonas sp.]MDD3476768.1 DUF1016 N-terminal domain-containing protein [Sulfurimonas sp.]
MKPQTIEPKYKNLLDTICETYETGKVRAFNAVNTELVKTYWEIGKYIVEFEQNGAKKAEYGKGLLEQLSGDLSIKYGKGFSRSNLVRFRQFYSAYPICSTLSHKLSWSHIVEFLKISGMSSQLFVQKYQLYLPNKDELRKEIENILKSEDED